MKRIYTILHPTDFSKGSDIAFQYACDLARDYDARLIVLHTMEPITPLVGEGGLIPNDWLALRDAAWKHLDAMHATDPGVRMKKLFQDGPASARIVETATELDADVIVMGTHGRTGIGRLILGSVAEEVLRRAPCPVLMVKATPPGKVDRRAAATPELAVGG